MNKTPTPHNEAKLGEIAKTIIMPGDPNRAKFIVENYLTDARLVNSVRGMFCWTGKYKNKTVSVMAHGMGNPSMGIYSYELFNFYDVENIIRVGSCGTSDPKMNLGDIIIATKSITQTNYANLLKNNIAEIDCSEKLQNNVKKAAKMLKFVTFDGNLYCSDTFYEDADQTEIMQKYNCLGVEMESASLYFNAKKARKNAITICTVSDLIAKQIHLTSKEREINFSKMITLALESV